MNVRLLNNLLQGVMRGVKCEGVCKHFCRAQLQLASSGPVASCTEISFLIPEGDTGNRNANYLTQLDLISIVSQPIKVVVDRRNLPLKSSQNLVGNN